MFRLGCASLNMTALFRRMVFAFVGKWMFAEMQLSSRKRTSLASHAVFAGVDGGTGFAVGFAALLGLALVPVLLALGDG